MATSVGLVLGVEDRERRRKAHQRPVAAQQALADRVERAGRDARDRSEPARRAARSTISRAARRVKVTSMIRSGGVPVSTRWASVATIVRVLPEPAEASTSDRPRAPSTAASCSASSIGPQALRDPRRRGRGAQAVDAPRRRVGGQRVPGRMGVADGLLPLDVRQRRRRRLPAGVAVCG